MLIKEKEISEVKNIMRYKKNITLKLENISSYFTGKNKIITLSLIILMLSLINITLGSSNNSNSVLSLFGLSSTSVSALSYESNVGIGFTFNPTLAISFSSSDLVISNLTPGTTSDSNNIVVSVSTNAAYGYTLSTNVGSNDIASPYYHSSDLVHSNNNNNGSNSNHVFSSIAIGANYSDLSDFSTNADINTWGYSTSLDNGTTWSSYNGLSTSTNTTLVDSNDMTSSTIDFKIAAKASDNQASGVYSNVINFIAVSKVAPTSLLDAFIASGAEQYNGYFKMQDMTSDICNAVDDALIPSELQLIDIRDNKVYWVAKLADKNCWMTQNLDLDLSHEVALTSETSDIDPESYGTTIYTSETGYSQDENTSVVSWLPERSTYTSITAPGTDNWTENTGDNTTSGYYHPYSWDRINNDGGPIYPDSTVTKAIAGNHAQSGNYYNWSAALASNNSYNASGNQKNSVCAKGWKIPANDEYSILYNTYKTTENHEDAFGLMSAPLLFVRSGVVNGNGGLDGSNSYGFYWSSTLVSNVIRSYSLFFRNTNVNPRRDDYSRYYGFSIRCLAK